MNTLLGDVKNAFRRAFPDIKDGGTELTWQGAGDSFQVSLGHKTLGVVGHLLVRCAFGPHECPETFQKLLDTCRALGCKIYDPQRGEFL